MASFKETKCKKHEYVLGWIGMLLILPPIIYLGGLMFFKEVIPMEFSAISGIIGLIMMIYFWRKDTFAGMGKDGIYHRSHRGKYVKRTAQYKGDNKITQLDIELTNSDPRGKLVQGKEYSVEVFVENAKSYAIVMLDNIKYNAKFFNFR